jgi:hypothetical protein
LKGLTRRAGYTVLLAGFAGAAALSVALSPAGGQGIVMDDLQSGLSEWRKIETVLTHPRCLNCHTVTGLPTQGDDRRPHPFEASPEADPQAGPPSCNSCHTEGWRMAPLALAFENEPGKPAPGAALCYTLTTGRDDEEPDYERMIEFAQLSSVVLQAWELGKGQDGAQRSVPAVSHEEFVDALKRWISTGAPCPAPEATSAEINPPPAESSPR